MQLSVLRIVPWADKERAILRIIRTNCRRSAVPMTWRLRLRTTAELFYFLEKFSLVDRRCYRGATSCDGGGRLLPCAATRVNPVAQSPPSMVSNIRHVFFLSLKLPFTFFFLSQVENTSKRRYGYWFKILRCFNRTFVFSSWEFSLPEVVRFCAPSSWTVAGRQEKRSRRCRH